MCIRDRLSSGQTWLLLINAGLSAVDRYLLSTRFLEECLIFPLPILYMFVRPSISSSTVANNTITINRANQQWFSTALSLCSHVSNNSSTPHMDASMFRRSVLKDGPRIRVLLVAAAYATCCIPSLRISPRRSCRVIHVHTLHCTSTPAKWSKNVVCVCAVSYTHLDVYKRQDTRCNCTCLQRNDS